MFNLYQNLGKRDDECPRSDFTGHDRFCQERPGNRRRRRPVSRRTQSAIELDSEAIVTARGVLRRGRSASIEDDDSDEERGYQLTNKIDNLAKILFNRVSAARGCRDQNDLRNGRHQYTALGNGPSTCEDVGEYVELEKRSRDRALSICQVYLQGTPRYTLIKQLNNVGSRVDKHWFAVRDTSLKADRLMTLVPLNRNCSLNICPATKDIVNNLFLALQHPYICPVLDLEFIEYEGKNYVILVQPINQGSLKDLVYGIERNCWNEDWSQKYAARGRGLPLPQIQQMGRQILEALVFLKERGFPVVTHLHSGNVIVQNGVARLAGLENTLLGFTSRIHPVVTSRLSNANYVDTICFGHMLFEMCAGFELNAFKPTAVHLSDIEKYPQVVELLGMIFGQSGNRYPTIEELLVHDLFRNIDLREMRSAPVTIFRPTLTPSIVNLLDGIKRQNTIKSRHRSNSTSDVLLSRRYR
ncbi:slowpoke-binding protein isoform X2 [Orussus abietinus]|uniref:slowpoke-binding protein isoform X2 n=1 Tax=Orussus abietinus TaxID=222816 RepID=UPI000625666D|nr:slowpoke-binding protein isoform X2 [Orussus abietinus]